MIRRIAQLRGSDGALRKGDEAVDKGQARKQFPPMPPISCALFCRS